MQNAHCTNASARRAPLILDDAEMCRLRYDLSNYAFIEADLLAEADQHKRHLVADICQEGNIDRVAAAIEIAVSQLPKHGCCDTKLCHEYVVAKVLADWLEIVHPEAAPKWQAKAAEALSGLTARWGRLRRRLPPF